jgi:hypothetical protein
MANPTITTFDPYDGVRAVEASEQGELTIGDADDVARLTILGRITATGLYGAYNSGNSPAGTNVPVAVSLSRVNESAAGDYPLSVLLAGRVDSSKLIIDGSEAGVGITEAIKDSLRTFGIIVEDVTETAALDNA